MRSLYCILAVFIFVAAVSSKRFEMAAHHQGRWMKGERVESHAQHSIAFAIRGRPNALATCDSLLMDISSPTSPNYGNHLTFEEIGQKFGNPGGYERVMNWLKVRAMGRSFTIHPTLNKEFIVLTAPVAELEELLSTEFYYYSHPETNVAIKRTQGFSLPKDIASRVDFVGNTIHFPSATTKIGAYQSLTDGTVTPTTIWNYYNVPSTPVTNPGATQSVFEALGQNFSPSDLAAFQKEYNLKQTPIAKIIGPNDPTQCETYAGNCGEANLDVQYILAIAQGAKTTFWSIDQSVDDIFLAWVVALANTTNPPLVHSISYSSLAKEDEVADVFRTSLEICKLGLRGLTVLASSGDDGVANFAARSNSSACGFNPGFPATSPYVTAVGATQGPESGKPEIACSSSTGGGITTGGGFSYYFKRPAWQAAAVAKYLTTAPNLPPKKLYNSTNRGYPDVALLGYNYNLIIGGSAVQESGTSASTPVFAAMLTLINNDRLNAKKRPLGFINPSLYALPSNAFNDITVGENNCCAEGSYSTVCCTYGFNATAGWDPLTGLGSPKFPLLRRAFLALP